ncbi:uncharacterized protein LOC113562416 [Ooceraea biroi]|uniref:uncharacterized protein LOC113562416 n=1 Tax=Ooceraea biroi TaxID=2015173 RepID=UPI000F07B1B6|nr:uncharacterized protein LOC113562416 [Ooceraea biroi]
MGEDYPGCRNLIRTAFERKHVPKEALDIIISSLSDSFIKQYDVCFKRWWNFCFNNDIQALQFSVPNVLSFLSNEFNNGTSYGTINSFRSAIALLYGPELGTNQQIKRFIKGIARLRPSMPKYDFTWDPSIVLNFLASWGSNEILSLEQLSLKLATLMALVTGHRFQTLTLIDVRNVEKRDEIFEIKIPERIKTSGIGCQQPVLAIPFYTQNVLICPATTLSSYLRRTSDLRTSHYKLFLSFKKPHEAVSTQTLSRWVKKVVTSAGINTNYFSAYTTRHASTSCARRSGVNIDLILKTAGWSKNSQTFARFYNRTVIPDKGVFGTSVLNAQDK